MFRPYREILSIPGACAFSFAGMIARLPMAMVSVAIVLMVSKQYDSYALAGQLAAASVIAYALGAPQVSKLVNRYGQARVMLPALAVSATTLIGLALAGIWQAHPVWMFLCAIISAAFSGSIGSLVRSRWAEVAQNPHQLHSAFSLEAAFDEIVYMLGPMVATFAATLIHPAGGLLAAAGFAIGGGVWLFMQTATEPPARGARGGQAEASVLKDPIIILFMVLYLVIGGVLGAMTIIAVAFTAERGAAGMAGVAMAVMALGSLSAALVYGSRQWRSSQAIFVVVALTVGATGASLLLVSDTIMALLATFFVCGMAISPLLINVNQVVQQWGPSGRLAESLTWLSAAMSIGAAGANAITGALVDAHGAGGGVMFAVVGSWIGLGYGIAIVPYLRRREAAARGGAE